MPVQGDIPWEDIGKAAFPTLLPIGIAGLGWYMYMKKKDQVAWYEKLKKPSWVITCPRTLSAIDLAVIAPVGYAAHMVCKEGQGADRQLALGLYGAGLLVWTAGIPAFVYTKDLKCWFGIEAAAATAFGAAAAAFYKVNNTAGLLLVPLTAWLVYGAVGLSAVIQANAESKQN